MSDRGYINLIRQLTRTSSSLPIDTLQASIAHYLARPAIPIPGSPTPLVATVLASPLFHPYTHNKLSPLILAFRHAVHIRIGMHKEEAETNPDGILTGCVNVVARLAKWCLAVLEGFRGSVAIVRLACASGLLLGLQDWEAELQLNVKRPRIRAKVEETIVLALAEVVDAYVPASDGWEIDFKRTAEAKGEEDPLALSMLLSSQCASFIAPKRLQALPLNTISNILVSTICQSFGNGDLLSTASRCMTINIQGQVVILPTTPFAMRVQSLADSPYLSSMASLARFAALALSVTVESRPGLGWEAISRSISSLQSLTETVERDWTTCPLARVVQDADLADDVSRDLATATWSILKTLLFTTLMVSQSILSTVIFVPTSNGSQSPKPSLSSPPYSLALGILRTLSHLSFVMPQFGGVASTSESGLPELKRAFYMALDLLSASECEARQYVQELGTISGVAGKGKAPDSIPPGMMDARRSFALACVEQLVSVLSEDVIQTDVYPLCFPHLWNPRHRETYESAHSVMLAIFASHAQRLGLSSEASSPFVENIVPMYARCLVENSSDGHLSTTQLCMAYAALVRSASSFSYGYAPEESFPSSTRADSMAWYCVEVLLDAISHARAAPIRATLPYAPDSQLAASSAASFSSAAGALALGEAAHPPPTEHLHRLHLVLVATVPAVSLVLLPRLLIDVKAVVASVVSPGATNAVVRDERTDEMRMELVQALFKTILEDVGDGEKAYAIEWWYANREELVNGTNAASHPVVDASQTTSARTAGLVSRL